MKKIAPALLAGLCLVPAANAAEKVATIPVKDGATAETLSRGVPVPYTYAELGYLMSSLDDADADLDTISLGGSFLFMPSIFALGSYNSGSLDVGGADFDITSLQLGGGYRHALSTSIDLVASLEFVQAEIKDTPADDSGYQLSVGVRGLLMDKIEGAAGISHTDVFDEASTTLNLSALYDLSQFVPKLQAGIDLALGDDAIIPESAKGYGVKVRYSF